MAQYKVSANLSWNMEGETFKDAEDKATEILLKLVKLSGLKLKSRINMHKLKDRPQVRRLGEFDPADVLPFVGPGRKDYQIGEDLYKVRMNSQRYWLFAQERSCVVCGVEGSKMVLELPPGSQQPHFNLYAIEDNEYLLMTKDHIKPKSIGGKDALDNYQTMCAICNGLKGCVDLPLEDLKALRDIYNHYKDKTTPSQLYQIINKEKEGRSNANRKKDPIIVAAVRKVLVTAIPKAGEDVPEV